MDIELEPNGMQRDWITIIAILFLIFSALFLGYWAYNFGRDAEREWNCSDFTSRQELNQFVKDHPNDPYNLDGDNDGTSCDDVKYPER